MTSAATAIIRVLRSDAGSFNLTAFRFEQIWTSTSHSSGGAGGGLTPGNLYKLLVAITFWVGPVQSPERSLVDPMSRPQCLYCQLQSWSTQRLDGASDYPSLKEGIYALPRCSCQPLYLYKGRHIWEGSHCGPRASGRVNCAAGF